MGSTIHALIALQTQRAPEAVAVVDASDRQAPRSLTYGELSARATQLARALRAAGVGPEVLVGVCVERSLDMIVGVLAILEAGGAYVPLDPAYPAERLAFMVADARMPVVLTQIALRHLVPAGPRILCVDTDRAELARHGAGELPLEVTADNLAYVVYTSGSTGKPKGVLIEHGGLCNTIAAMVDSFEVGPDSRFLQFASLSFDASVAEIFTALVGGATLYVASRDALLPGPRLAQLLRDCGITVFILPPSVLAMTPPHELPALRTVISAGEACSAQIVARWSQGRRFLNAYGPSEVSICATIGACRDGARKPSIGTAIRNCQVYLLDAALRPVPAGAEGELFVGGRGLARGYLNRPELTARAFVDDPFADHAGARLYRTGDLARMRPDGELDFLGRVDDQVKLRGFRIELGEIDAVIRQHPAVADVAVIVWEPDPEARRLVAYIVAGAEPAPSASELRAFTARQLPEHMIPSAFVAVPVLPLTPNGKVDRRALPPPSSPASAGASAGSAPDAALAETALEAQLAAIWGSVLGLARIGVDDDFTALGGDSLRYATVLARIQELTGVDIALRVALELRTVRQLAAVIASATPARGVPAIARVERSPAMPVSFAQRRLWYADQLSPHNAAFHVQFAIELGGALDEVALRHAVDAIVDRHEVLRTRFTAVDGEPFQVIEPRAEVWESAASVSDVSELDAERIAADEAQRPFDLARGPVLRVRLLRLARDRWWLLVTGHHIAIDAGSFRPFVDDLGALYDAFIAGRESPLAPLAIQYADYASWQRASLTPEVVGAELAYWRARLAGCPRLRLPTDRARPKQPTQRGALVPFDLRPLGPRLAALAHTHGATLQMLLLAVFAANLGVQTGERDVVLGIATAIRRHPSLDPLIGLFINEAPIRIRVDAGASFDAVLREAREAVLGAFEHDQLPIADLIHELRPPRRPGEYPLYGVSFTLLSLPAVRLSGLEARVVVRPIPHTRMDLELDIYAGPDGITGCCSYSAELFDAETIVPLVARFERACADLVR